MTPHSTLEREQLAFPFLTSAHRPHKPFVTIPTDDVLRLVERVQAAGLRAKPEVGIQFGAGGATTPIVQLECPRRSLWGTKSLWRRVVNYPGE